MAALEVRLINGDVACTTDASKCHDIVPGTSTSAGAAPRAASSGSGIKGFGDPGTNIARVALADTTAAASMNGQGNPPCVTDCNPGNQPGCNGPGSGPSCPLSETAAIASLPKTGMLGGFAIPAGLLLIAVAISLRVAPGLRTRLRGMR
jgi:hypothetical protein